MKITGFGPKKLKDSVVYIVFIGIFLLFSVILFDRGFLTSGNLLNIARQSAMIAIMSVGMTFVLCTAEIDLSFGAVVALSAITSALAMRATGSILLSVLAGLASGLLVGAINGIFVAWVGIPSFLVTLGTTGIVSGVARWVSRLQSIPIDNDLYIFLFGSGDIGPIPILFFWTIFIAIIGSVVLKKTAFGRKVLATGGNKISALYSGIKTDRIKFSVMVINSLLAALAGILYTGRLHGARYTLGENEVMVVIAAVIIGGTSMFGGRGSVIGSVIGALIMGILNNGLILMGLSVDQQLIFRGIIIIAAVSLTMREKKGK
ncbi:MAG: ABC transporter permease [Rectinemataceae bacterium]